MTDFNAMAEKWQERWQAAGIFKTDIKGDKPKFYCLEMFPYPSAYGLHMGHARNYTMGDVIARFKRMQGYDVLYPMGYDAFGLPAENAAIKNKTHPKTYTDNAIKSISAQQRALGSSYDWDRMVVTCSPEYYRWNQWLFLQFHKRGLVYRKSAPINWCPGCKTVLANEQVKDGKCWRCESTIEIKELEQWFIRITAYADALLKGLGRLDHWPEKIRIMQENWIGKSTGTLVEFELEGPDGKGSGETIPVFTTRPDTLFGVTFITFAPEHPTVARLIKGCEDEKEIQEFISKVVISEKFTRAAEDKPKEGMFIHRHAIHPLTGERIPIHIANFVLMEYGTGCVMAVPAHDQRDYEFAKKHGIPIKQVIEPSDGETMTRNASIAHNTAYTGPGRLINSGRFDGLPSDEAKTAITKELARQGKGEATTQFKIRDWLISRQRYWGTPIPMVYCERCGVVPVPEKDLPVILPQDVQFTGAGNPLLTSQSFVNTACPNCGRPARRETDTMDTFFDSSWYFLRYCSPHDDKKAFDSAVANRLLPVDQYIGGAEHAVMHLLYARFFTRVLKDMGLVGFDEPFTRLFNQGMVTKDGNKMSKSYGNVVAQDDIAREYGIDTARLFLMFVSSPESELEWSDEGVEGAFRFLNRVFALAQESPARRTSSAAKDTLIESKRNACVKETTEHLDAFRLNKAVLAVMEFANALAKHKDDVSDKEFRASLDTLSRLLLPFTPHLAEEMWALLGNEGFLSVSDWPQADESRIDERVERDAAFVEETLANVRRVIAAKKIGSPSSVTLFPAERWKYAFVAEFRRLFATVKNPKEIADRLAAHPDLSHNREDVLRLSFAVYKNMALLPLVDRTAQEELSLLQEAVTAIRREFGCEASIGDAADPKDQKARSGLPERPAINVA